MSDEVQNEIARRFAECERINGEMRKLERRITGAKSSTTFIDLNEQRLTLKTEKLGHQSVIAGLKRYQAEA